MAVTNWITADQVKTFAVRKTEFDTTIINQNIYSTQVKYLREFLGSKFYDEIHAQIEGSTVTTDNQTLLDDYLEPALAFFVMAESVIDQHYKATNAGFVVDQPEHSEAVQTRELDLIRNNYLSKANTLLRIAQIHIEDSQESDSTKFPLYNEGTSDDGRRAGVTEYIPDVG